MVRFNEYLLRINSIILTEELRDTIYSCLAQYLDPLHLKDPEITYNITSELNQLARYGASWSL